MSKPASHRRLARTRVAALSVLAGLLLQSAPANSAELDLARFRGQVVIVDFWASWCKPCRESIPWLNQMRARYRERGLVIVGVNVDAERRDADRFLRDVPIDFEVLFDPAGELAKHFDIQGMPTSLLIDRSGKVVERYLGYRDSQKAPHEAALQKLLSPPAAPH